MAPGKVEDDDDSDYGSVGDDELLELESGINKRKSSDDKQQEPPPAKKAKSEPEANSAASLIARKVLSKSMALLRISPCAGRSRDPPDPRPQRCRGLFRQVAARVSCTQVPALAFDMYDDQRGLPPGGGVSLVISPLIRFDERPSRCIEETGRRSCRHGLRSPEKRGWKHATSSKRVC